MLSQVQTGVVSRCCSRRLTVMLMQMKRATFWFNKESMRHLSQSKRCCLNVSPNLHAGIPHYWCVKSRPEPSECCFLAWRAPHLRVQHVSWPPRWSSGQEHQKIWQWFLSRILRAVGANYCNESLPSYACELSFWGRSLSLEIFSCSCSSLFDICCWHKN